MPPTDDPREAPARRFLAERPEWQEGRDWREDSEHGLVMSTACTLAFVEWAKRFSLNRKKHDDFAKWLRDVTGHNRRN